MSRRLALASLLPLGFVACLPAAPAAEMQPIAVLSFSGYERFVADVAALGETAKNKTLPSSLAGFLRRKTGIESLEGLDRGRPLGMVLATDGLAVVPIAFVPVADGEKLLRSLEKLIGKPERLADGLWKIGREKVTGFVRQRGDWAYLAQSEDNLRWLPDPAKTLGDLPKRFDVALEFNWQHVPDVFRTMGVDLLRLAMRNNLARRPGETDAEHQLRHRGATWQFRVIEQLMTDSRQLTLGWTVDERTKQARLDLRLTPEPESGMAKQLASLRATKTRFGGLAREDSPLSLHVNWALTASQVDKLGGELSGSRKAVLERIGEFAWIKSPTERQTFQQVAGSVLDVLDKTVRTSQVDLALAVLPSATSKEGKGADKSAAERPLTVVAAAHVGEGDSLRLAFEAVARLGEEDERFAGFRRNVAKVEGRDVHALVFPSDQRQIAKRLFGDELTLYVMTTADGLCAAIGPDALEQLRLALRPQRAEIPPLKLEVRLGGVADVLERSMGPNYFTPLAAAAKGSDDRVTVTVQAEGDELHAQLVFQEGVLKASASALALALFFGG
jgi:hypothetical protein